MENWATSVAGEHFLLSQDFLCAVSFYLLVSVLLFANPDITSTACLFLLSGE